MQILVWVLLAQVLHDPHCHFGVQVEVQYCDVAGLLAVVPQLFKSLQIFVWILL